MISSFANFRAISWSCFCSSDRVRSIITVVYQTPPMKRQSKHPRIHPRSRPQQDDREEGATRPARREAVLKSFQKIWSDLFTSPVHLDSALAKQPKNMKGILAQIVPIILLKPVSQAQALGIGLSPDEPWSLNEKKLSEWRPAGLMAERLHEA